MNYDFEFTRKFDFDFDFLHKNHIYMPKSHTMHLMDL